MSRDGQTDKVKPVYPPFNFFEAGSIKTFKMQHSCAFTKIMSIVCITTHVLSQFMMPVAGVQNITIFGIW